MVKREKTKGYIIYGNPENFKSLAIFTHGASEDYSSEFMQFIIKELVGRQYLVMTFVFDFFRKKEGPSESLDHEIGEVEKAVQYASSNFNAEEIYLIGKSLGGVVNLAYQAKNNNRKIKTVAMLGLPIVLGFPLRMELLWEKDPKFPDYRFEYEKLLKGIKTKTLIIQGDKDDLYDREVAESMFNDISYIKNANHGFKDAWSGARCYQECADLLGRGLGADGFSKIYD